MEVVVEDVNSSRKDPGHDEGLWVGLDLVSELLEELESLIRVVGGDSRHDGGAHLHQGQRIQPEAAMLNYKVAFRLRTFILVLGDDRLYSKGIFSHNEKMSIAQWTKQLFETSTC